jgi:hypothetical protein
MQFYEYKGYIIYPIPQRSVDSKAWEAVLSIRKGNHLKIYKTEYLHKTKGEAVFHCISLGKKIIDGDGGEFTTDGL